MGVVWKAYLLAIERTVMPWIVSAKGDGWVRLNWKWGGLLEESIG